jgi:uncharacterized membrane protein HdeD (DUF308 family)
VSFATVDDVAVDPVIGLVAAVVGVCTLVAAFGEQEATG